MRLSELKETFLPGWYVDEDAFASSGDLNVYFVHVPSDMPGPDHRLGVVLERGGFAVYVPLHSLPALADILSGIVQRAKLQ
jgi:hypothetical protein